MKAYLNSIEKELSFGIKIYVYKFLSIILRHLDQKLIFSDGTGRHFEFGSLAKNAVIFARGMGAKSFIKCP